MVWNATLTRLMYRPLMRGDPVQGPVTGHPAPASDCTVGERSPGCWCIVLIHSITLHTPLFAELIQDKLGPDIQRPQ